VYRSCASFLLTIPHVAIDWCLVTRQVIWHYSAAILLQGCQNKELTSGTNLSRQIVFSLDLKEYTESPPIWWRVEGSFLHLFWLLIDLQIIIIKKRWWFREVVAAEAAVVLLFVILWFSLVFSYFFFGVCVFSAHMQDLQEVTQDVHYENFRLNRLKNGAGAKPRYDCFWLT